MAIVQKYLTHPNFPVNTEYNLNVGVIFRFVTLIFSLISIFPHLITRQNHVLVLKNYISLKALAFFRPPGVRNFDKKYRPPDKSEQKSKVPNPSMPRFPQEKYGKS